MDQGEIINFICRATPEKAKGKWVNTQSSLVCFRIERRHRSLKFFLKREQEV